MKDVTLIIPCAGKSSRYGFKKPKWALTHPSGKLMVEESLMGINFDNIKSAVFVFHSDHQNELKTDLTKMAKKFNLPVKSIEVLIIDQTKSQVDTVIKAITKKSILGPIAIKDCDNYFTWEPKPYNAIAVKKVTETDDIRFLQQKSFVKVASGFEIVEKKIVSDMFCVGGYSFKSAVKFLESATAANCEYISQVISNMVQDDFDKPVFDFNAVSDYLDWGNRESWQEFRSSYKTLFVDIDGVIFQNGSGYFQPKWESTTPIVDNVNKLNKMKNSYIVLTTARPERLRKKTIQLLSSYGIRYDQLVMGLPHAKRILINDYDSQSNPYPTAICLNVRRNSNELAEILSD